MSDYYKDASQCIYDLMKQTFSSRMNGFFLGTPNVQPPEGAFPYIIVQKMSDTTTEGATMSDDLEEVINIHFLHNRLDDFNSSDEIDTTMRQMQQWIEGRTLDGQYDPSSAMYALRVNRTLGGHVIDINSIQKSYDMTPRPDQPAIIEGIISLTISSRVYITT